MLLPDPSMPWPINRAGVAMIAERESCRLRAYRNYPNEPWTCGWGETDGVGPDTVWTQDYADQRFCDSLKERVTAVLEACTVAPNENQLAALVSLAYNIGMGWKGKTRPKGAKKGLRQSTVLAQHNAGNFDAAANAFGLWNKVDDGKGGLTPAKGLTIRRAMESALYVTPPAGTPTVPMPQVVAAESTMAQSPINRTSAVIVGAGTIAGIDPALKAITAAKEVADGAATLKEPLGTIRAILIDTLGIQPDWILPIVLVCGGLYIIHWRRRQRDEGRA